MTFISHIWLKRRNLWRIFRAVILFGLAIFLMGGSVLPPRGLSSQVHGITRPIEFDYGTWTLDAITAKISHWALSLERFISPEMQSQLVLDYLEQVQKVNRLNTEVLIIYADPTVHDPDSASVLLRSELQKESAWLESLAPAAESILQTQLMGVLQDIGLDTSGQVWPPSLYQTSEMPNSLVISPRDEIRQTYDVSLLPGLSTEAKDQLEMDVFQQIDHAALVVPVGGIGTYPTMVMQTSDLVWLTEVIAHEWVHNFLTLRPLGINYFTNDELRTINETTASLSGKELGLLILQKYYPEHVPPELKPSSVKATLKPDQPDPNAFDFRAEMRKTRLEVDRLLAEGEIETAEAFMETRRQFFWDNGYLIRKLNQAYFAFYGAYNDVPGGGASGEDPIGPAVVAFREQFDSLADFLNAISWVNSYQRLMGLLEG